MHIKNYTRVAGYGFIALAVLTAAAALLAPDWFDRTMDNGWRLKCSLKKFDLYNANGVLVQSGALSAMNNPEYVQLASDLDHVGSLVSVCGALACVCMAASIPVLACLVFAEEVYGARVAVGRAVAVLCLVAAPVLIAAGAMRYSRELDLWDSYPTFFLCAFLIGLSAIPLGVAFLRPDTAHPRSKRAFGLVMLVLGLALMGFAMGNTAWYQSDGTLSSGVRVWMKGQNTSASVNNCIQLGLRTFEVTSPQDANVLGSLDHWQDSLVDMGGFASFMTKYKKGTTAVLACGSLAMVLGVCALLAFAAKTAGVDHAWMAVLVKLALGALVLASFLSVVGITDFSAQTDVGPSYLAFVAACFFVLIGALLVWSSARGGLDEAKPLAQLMAHTAGHNTGIGASAEAGFQQTITDKDVAQQPPPL